MFALGSPPRPQANTPKTEQDLRDARGVSRKIRNCVLSRRGVDSSELAYGGFAGFLGSLACQGWSLPKKPVEKGG